MSFSGSLAPPGQAWLDLALREAQEASDGHWGGLSALEVRGGSARRLLGFPFHLMEGLDHSLDKAVTVAALGRV